MRTILFVNNLILIFSLFQSSASPRQMEIDSIVQTARPQPAEINSSMAGLTISLEAATSATILFEADNGREVNAPNEEGQKIPYLVLNRNSVPTPNFERTLHLSLGNLTVPSSGLYASLELDTQHSDPDNALDGNDKIRVWEEKRFVPYSSDSHGQQSIDFTILFQRMFDRQGKAVRTPADYYSYQVTLRDAQGNLLRTIEKDYAFLLENQWRVPLPKVLEATPGAAPNELVLYYYDMIPFQANPRDPETRIPRQDIERYIQTELVPAMVEAFKVQTNDWGLPWYKEWKNSRTEENPKTLSVALDEYDTWFHGAAPSLGHAMISIRVDGSFGEYENITDGILSVFHHELFHNQQRNISLHFGSKGNILGKDHAWELFSEGTAVLASLVGEPAVQMSSSGMPRSYLKRANSFLGADGVFPGGLNKSYTEIPYQTALYWRFLYEQCGGIRNGTEDPATGMRVIRRVLETLYSGKIVDINSSTSAVEVFPHILDVALYKSPDCPFHNFDESLVRFTRAIYLLRQADGRCAENHPSTECGFYDPNKVYSVPGEEKYTLANHGKTAIDGSIRSSFGVDLIGISASPSVDGKSLKIFFKSTSNPHYIYNLELWAKAGKNAETDRLILSRQTHLAGLIEVDTLRMDQFQSLDLVVTRMDTYENESQPGQYTVQFVVD